MKFMDGFLQLLRCGFEIIRCKMLFQIHNTSDFIEQNPYLLLKNNIKKSIWKLFFKTLYLKSTDPGATYKFYVS